MREGGEGGPEVSFGGVPEILYWGGLSIVVVEDW